MRFSAPKKATWWIALILAALGVVGTFISIPLISGIAFWLVVAGYVLLALSTSVKNL
ncbi:hypothetical protein JW777_02640 [bacterium]|nr:hypothetical protein [bacterium]